MWERVAARMASGSHPSRGAWIEMGVVLGAILLVLLSHPSRGAWIEIGLQVLPKMLAWCRTPHGVRGLKSALYVKEVIQIGRTPHGVRGLKSNANYNKRERTGRTPHGVRGLKYAIAIFIPVRYASHPSRGAWIEIQRLHQTRHRSTRRTPHGVRGLKYFSRYIFAMCPWSHPSRGAWIEIRRGPLL